EKREDKKLQKYLLDNIQTFQETKRLTRLPSTGDFKTKVTTKKVKSFYNKKDESKFFLSHKKQILFPRSIKIESELDIFKVQEKIESLKPEIIPFLKKYIKGRGYQQKINIGYYIKVKVMWSQKPYYFYFPNHLNASYLPSFIVT